MSLDRIFGVAGGAMDAQVIRMNLAVSNIANAEVTESSEEDAYKAKRPIFETILAKRSIHGAAKHKVACVCSESSKINQRTLPTMNPDTRMPMKKAMSTCPMSIR